MANHTPGPWVLGTYDNASYNITGPQGSLPFIATVSELANARLIAAAPDLLAALVALRAAVSITPTMQDRSYIDLGIQVNAAIARAQS